LAGSIQGFLRFIEGQRQFEKVLNWAKDFAGQKNLKFVRMDTWADNGKIIDYYKSFGFEFIEYYQTTDALNFQFKIEI
jgi:ribosomal protein S18 acetylase RimI-like enzyme